MPLPIGLQLYTVRDVIAKDVPGTLKRLAEIGYTHLELAGLYGLTAQEFKKHADSCGLKVCSSHTSVDAVNDDFDTVHKQAEVFGYKHVVCSGIFREDRTLKAWNSAVTELKSAAEKCAAAGLYFSYHNHAFEFDSIVGSDKRPFDLIFDEPNTGIGSELDVAWVVHGRGNPVEWMKRLSGRVPLLHIKDLTGKPSHDGGPTFTEVGTGVVPLREVIAHATACGAEYFLIEQDAMWKDGDPLKSVQISFDNFKALLPQ